MRKQPFFAYKYQLFFLVYPFLCGRVLMTLHFYHSFFASYDWTVIVFSGSRLCFSCVQCCNVISASPFFSFLSFFLCFLHSLCFLACSFCSFQGLLIFLYILSSSYCRLAVQCWVLSQCCFTDLTCLCYNQLVLWEIVYGCVSRNGSFDIGLLEFGLAMQNDEVFAVVYGQPLGQLWACIFISLLYVKIILS